MPLVLSNFVIPVSGRAEELFRHRQVNCLNKLDYWSRGFGSLQPGVDRLQLFPRKRLDRTFVGVGGADGRKFLVGVDSDPDAVPNLVFPVT
jgi:hypothetical protein